MFKLNLFVYGLGYVCDWCFVIFVLRVFLVMVCNILILFDIIKLFGWGILGEEFNSWNFFGVLLK